MVEIKLTNSKTRRKEVFAPIDPQNVQIYVCGPTVYDRAHLGNARPVVVFDTLFRLMRHVYGDSHVTYVRNFTDVDDKINDRAKRDGRDIRAITDETIAWYHDDMDALGTLRPSHEPRATDYIPQMVAMISDLIDRGHAYAADGHVLFSVDSYAEYGALSGRTVEDMIAGARVEVAPYKRDPMDFVLWKPSDADTPGWDSPWGRGRPGWHIECSAMSKSCLGANFDIHGGGPDLKFPHHENEIAQSEAANGCQYVNYWMHAGAVRVDGEKMSKSLGNFFTIRDVLEKYHPEVIRYLIVSSHYRSSINYSEDNLVEAKAGLDRFYQTLKNYKDVDAAELSSLSDSEHYAKFVAAMNDDFNTRVALSGMYDLVKVINTTAETDATQAQQLVSELKAMADILGILQAEPTAFLQGMNNAGLSADMIETLVAERIQAKLDKEYARADEIRQRLDAEGVLLEDSKEVTTWRRK